MRKIDARLGLLFAVLSIVLVASRLIPRFLPKSAQPARKYGEVVLGFTDKHGRFVHEAGLGGRGSGGTQTFSDGRKWTYGYEYVGICSRGDVYLIELVTPEGSNLVQAVLYSGKPVPIVDTAHERIELRPAAHAPPALAR